jgi:hypothetical protein
MAAQRLTAVFVYKGWVCANDTKKEKNTTWATRAVCRGKMAGIENIGNPPLGFGLVWAALGGALPWGRRWSNVFMGLGMQKTVFPAIGESSFCFRWETVGFGSVSSRLVLIIPGEVLFGPDIYLRLISASSLPCGSNQTCCMVLRTLLVYP